MPLVGESFSVSRLFWARSLVVVTETDDSVEMTGTWIATLHFVSFAMIEARNPIR